MYDSWSALLVWVNTGLAEAVIGPVDAGPPPHCVEHPGVVGEMVAVLATLPAAMTAPLTV